jgi:hypothetical protein
MKIILSGILGLFLLFDQPFRKVIEALSKHLPSGVLAKEGKNEFVIFEQQNDTVHDVVKCAKEPLLESFKQKN